MTDTTKEEFYKVPKADKAWLDGTDTDTRADLSGVDAAFDKERGVK